MKLMDKIKDLFMDEIIDDDEIELEEEEKKEYKEPPKEVLPKVMRDTIAKEEKVEIKTKPEEFVRREERREERPQTEPKKFAFPIDFEEEVSKVEKKEQSVPVRNNNRKEFNESDFLPRRSSNNGNINVLNLEKENSKKTSELYPKKEDVKPKFKASPVISPVYGVLDKNYKKEEVREKAEDVKTMKRPSKQVDFETVRKKAFGNLADEIKDNLLCENCELYKEVKKISALKEDDLLYDMTVDDDKPVTIENAYDNYEEFGVAYEPKTLKNANENEEKIEEAVSSFNDIIRDSNEVEEILEQKEVVPEVIKETETEDIPSRQEKKKDAKVDDDFFKLIDSMYKERIDE